MSRSAQIERSTKETDVRLSLDLDGGEVAIATGVGLDHMLELLGRHGRLGLSVDATGDLETERITRPRTSGSPSVRRSTARSATAPEFTATGTWPCRWTRRSGCAQSTSRDGRFACSSRSFPGSDRGLRYRAHRGVLPRRGDEREADAPSRHPLRVQCAPHDRGVLQGIRPRAPPGGRDRPGREGSAVDKGDLT